MSGIIAEAFSLVLLLCPAVDPGYVYIDLIGFPNGVDVGCGRLKCQGWPQALACIARRMGVAFNWDGGWLWEVWGGDESLVLAGLIYSETKSRVMKTLMSVFLDAVRDGWKESWVAGFVNSLSNALYLFCPASLCCPDPTCHEYI